MKQDNDFLISKPHPATLLNDFERFERKLL